MSFKPARMQFTIARLGAALVVVFSVLLAWPVAAQVTGYSSGDPLPESNAELRHTQVWTEPTQPSPEAAPAFAEAVAPPPAQTQSVPATPATDSNPSDANAEPASATPPPAQTQAAPATSAPDPDPSGTNAEAASATPPPPSDGTALSTYGALADVLQDEDARKQLIEQLRVLAANESAMPDAETSASAAAGARAAANTTPTISQRLGAYLQGLTAQLGRDVEYTLEALARIGSSAGPTKNAWQRWRPALENLAITIGAVLIAYWLLRMLAGAIFAKLNVWIRKRPESERPADPLTTVSSLTRTSRNERMVPNTPPPATAQQRGKFGAIKLSRKVVAVVFALVVDLLATVLAALAGYVVAAGLTRGDTTTGLFAFQFLTAFTLIEAAKAVSRGLFATRYEELRLLPMQPHTARYWNRWITLLIALTGYCLMVVVPVSQTLFAASIGRLIGLIIMLCVYITGVRVVWSRRDDIRDALVERAENTRTAVIGTLLRVLARCWHWLALAYFTVLLVVSQADQQQAFAFMMSATVQSVLAVGIGAVLAAAVTAWEARQVHLPETWRSNFPMLEKRINSYMDPALRGLRLFLLVAVSLVVLDAWRAFDLGGWLDSDAGRSTVAMIIRVAFILAMAALSWTIVASLIEHRMGATATRRASEREKTLLMLFRNAAAILIGTMTVLILLSQVGIDIGPLIAGAGVAGLAIGFGAQKLVQDVITGVFIQLENGMNQNDVVEIVGLFGTVEKITIRSVGLRTLDGGYHLIPFSSIETVSNHTRDFGYHYAEYNIAHREDVDDAIAQLELAFKDLMEDPDLAKEVLADIEIPGVTSVTEKGFTIRVMIKTTPGNQWAIQRAFNRLMKRRFDAAGIELPYPHTVVHFGRDKTGYAAPVDVRAVEALKQVAENTAPPAGQTMRPNFKQA